MSEISLAQRIAFGQYINYQVFPRDEVGTVKCPFHTEPEDEQRLVEKRKIYERIRATVENSQDFLKTIASWRKDKNLALGPDFEKILDSHIDNKNCSLRDALSMVFRAITGNISDLFKNETLLKPVDGEKSIESVINDPQSVEGGLINSVSTQLAWTYVTLRKTLGESAQQISKILDNNKKALRSFLKLQFSLFNMVLNELGIQTIPIIGFNKMNETKLELLNLKNSAQILLPKQEVLEAVIAKAKQKDAYAVMHGGSSRRGSELYLRESSLPLGCPAALMSMESVRAPGDHDLKANLASEFMEYIDVVVKQKILPRLDRIKIDKE